MFQIQQIRHSTFNLDFRISQYELRISQKYSLRDFYQIVQQLFWMDMSGIKTALVFLVSGHIQIQC